MSQKFLPKISKASQISIDLSQQSFQTVLKDKNYELKVINLQNGFNRFDVDVFSLSYKLPLFTAHFWLTILFQWQTYNEILFLLLTIQCLTVYIFLMVYVLIYTCFKRYFKIKNNNNENTAVESTTELSQMEPISEDNKSENNGFIGVREQSDFNADDTVPLFFNDRSLNASRFQAKTFKPQDKSVCGKIFDDICVTCNQIFDVNSEIQNGNDNIVPDFGILYIILCLIITNSVLLALSYYYDHLALLSWCKDEKKQGLSMYVVIYSEYSITTMHSY